MTIHAIKVLIVAVLFMIGYVDVRLEATVQLYVSALAGPTTKKPAVSDDLEVEIDIARFSDTDPEAGPLQLACTSPEELERVLKYVNSNGYQDVHTDWYQERFSCLAFDPDVLLPIDAEYIEWVKLSHIASVNFGEYEIESPRIDQVKYPCGAELYVTPDFVFDEHLIDPDTGGVNILLATNDVVCALNWFQER